MNYKPTTVEILDLMPSGTTDGLDPGMVRAALRQIMFDLSELEQRVRVLEPLPEEVQATLPLWAFRVKEGDENILGKVRAKDVRSAIDTAFRKKILDGGSAFHITEEK